MLNFRQLWARKMRSELLNEVRYTASQDIQCLGYCHSMYVDFFASFYVFQYLHPPSRPLRRRLPKLLPFCGEHQTDLQQHKAFPQDSPWYALFWLQRMRPSLCKCFQTFKLLISKKRTTHTRMFRVTILCERHSLSRLSCLSHDCGCLHIVSDLGVLSFKHFRYFAYCTLPLSC